MHFLITVLPLKDINDVTNVNEFMTVDKMNVERSYWVGKSCLVGVCALLLLLLLLLLLFQVIQSDDLAATEPFKSN